MFSTGQLVVCIDAGPFRNPKWTKAKHCLVKGHIYRIARIYVLGPKYKSAITLRLEESPETTFRAERFRPLKKKDVDLFNSLLKPVNEDRLNQKIKELKRVYNL